MTPTKYSKFYVEGEDLYKLEKDGSYHKICKYVDNVGYYQVTIRIEKNVKKHIRLHRLIAETLLPNPNKYPQVNHIDGNKLNNSLNNLEWCTNSHNTKEAYDNGLYPTKRCVPIKITNTETGEITEYKSIRSASVAVGINRKTLTAYLEGRRIHPIYKLECV